MENIVQEEIEEKFHQKEVDLHNEFNKNILEKNEENSHLKKLNQGLTEQINKLINEKSENPHSYYQPVNHENHKQLKFLQVFHKRLK